MIFNRSRDAGVPTILAWPACRYMAHNVAFQQEHEAVSDQPDSCNARSRQGDRNQERAPRRPATRGVKCARHACHLTRAIATLEVPLKTRLINRTTRNVALSGAGTRQPEGCRGLPEELDRLESARGDTRAEPGGTSRHVAARCSSSLPARSRAAGGLNYPYPVGGGTHAHDPVQ